MDYAKSQRDAMMNTGLGSGLGMCAVVERPASPIECATQALRSANQDLASAIDELETRLGPVLAAAKPSSVNDTEKGSIGPCVLSSELSREADLASRSAAWIRALTERLCL